MSSIFKIYGGRFVAALLAALAAALSAAAGNIESGASPATLGTVIASSGVVYGIAHKLIDGWLNPTDAAAPSVVEKHEDDTI